MATKHVDKAHEAADALPLGGVIATLVMLCDHVCTKYVLLSANAPRAVSKDASCFGGVCREV